MPSVIVATVGGETSNSYVTLAEFLDFADDFLNAAISSNPDENTQALFMARRKLEKFSYRGAKTDEAQALLFPRRGAPKLNGQWISSVSTYPVEVYAEDEIPQPIKDAQCQLAIAYLGGFDETGTEAVESLIDGVRGTVNFKPIRNVGSMPTEVMQMIDHLLVKAISYR